MAEQSSIWSLGLMSGTSLDGVDAALVQTDGARILDLGPSAFLPYSGEDAAAIQPVMAEPLRFREARGPDDAALLARAELQVARLHARAAAELAAAAEVAPELVAFPGQTAAHAPEAHWTWQLGDGARLARALNRPVVWDFRSDDIRAGGQGAPLASFFHHALLRRYARQEGPVAVLNIGGVANVTWVDPAAPEPEAPGALAAFDTGPGNALVNDWMAGRTGQPVDRDGAAAAAGLAALAPGATTGAGGTFSTNLVHDFLARPGPKSLDRNAFNTLPGRLAGWSIEAGAAALTAFTADCARAAEAHLPAPPTRWLVCGGGRLNPTLMRLLDERLAAPVAPIEAIGLDGDMLEAQAFAFLAVRVLRGLPTSAPATTGCARPVSGGRIAYPSLPSGEMRAAPPR